MKKLLFISTLLFSFLLISCSTDTGNNSTTTNPVDVYIAGAKNGQACYWKNNQIILLSNGFGAEADTLIVSNADVHVFGKMLLANWSTELIYWKNNVATNLIQTFSTSSQIVSAITGMDVVGNDVYFVGYTKNPLITAEIYDLVYWKNGVKTIVNDNVNGIGKSKIKVINNDVYITAPSGDPNNTNFSVNGFYKNGVFTEVENTNLIDFAMKNNEINVYGSYQLGNKIHNITTNTDTLVGFADDAQITHLCFDNNNIYYSNVNEIFKNGGLFIPRPIEYSGIIDFKVLNNNVYALRGFGANPAYALEINNITIIQNAIDETFKSLYIVQN